MTRPPLLIGGLAMMWGYIKSGLTGVPHFEDKTLSAFIKRYQWACLLKGKKKATAQLNDKQANVWFDRRL
jgi:hypothetical protein